MTRAWCDTRRTAGLVSKHGNTYLCSLTPSHTDRYPADVDAGMVPVYRIAAALSALFVHIYYCHERVYGWWSQQVFIRQVWLSEASGQSKACSMYCLATIYGKLQLFPNRNCSCKKTVVKTTVECTKMLLMTHLFTVLRFPVTASWLVKWIESKRSEAELQPTFKSTHFSWENRCWHASKDLLSEICIISLFPVRGGCLKGVHVSSLFFVISRKG